MVIMLSVCLLVYDTM